jgi:class 3 adenylate cyclase
MVHMIVPSALLNLTTLSPELREQLHDFLPIEFKNCLDSLNGPTIENLHAIHAHLSHLRSSLSATVPRWLLDTLTKSERPFDQSLDATVLLADVTGFTRVTAQLGALGRAGNEYLTYALNQAFKVAVRSLLTYGGDLLAFGGDALLAVFRGPDCAAAATTSAWQMQAALAALDLDPFIGLSEPLRLQIKIGLASGPLILAHVGSTTRRLTLALGQVLDTTDAIAGTTAPACIRLDYLTAAAVDSIAQLTAQADGSFLLSGLNRQLLLHSEIVPENIVSSIGALTAHVAELAPYVPLHVFTALAGASQARPGDGEQRHVISMFSHLTGLNALADTLGRERTDIAVEIAGLTIERAVNIIESYGGALARVDTYPGGHKLLALFGAPVAHEHDAERALRAAQALRDAMKQLNAEVLDRFASHRMYLLNQATHAQPLLNIRTGINAGLVVAGLIGSPERYEYTVMGDSVNVAARLMGKADLNRSEILIGESVYEQISDLLDAEACMLSLKGKRELLRAWSVQHVRMRVYPEPSQRPPLVGRDAERRIVRSAIDSLHDGKGQIVFIRGEAGVGKTRLVREIPVWLDSRIACVQTGSPGLTPVSFGLFRTLLLALAHAQLDVAQHTFSEQLDALIERFCPGHLAELRPSLAMLMRLDDADLTSASTDPAVQQRVLARSLQTLLSGLAMEQPFVWVCEDVHQADDASLAVLEQMIPLDGRHPGCYARPLVLRRRYMETR